jgi:hypothetical protein
VDADARQALSRYLADGRRDLVAAAEALLDPRIGAGAVPPALLAELGTDGWPGLSGAGEALAELAAGRAIEWAAATVTQGEVLAAFARHCADELDDVEVVEATAVRLVARWRRETATLELRCGAVGCERLAGEQPTLLLADLDGDVATLIERFASEPALRGSLALLDLARLEKINTVRSSVFVYLEWFLRDAYGVKLLTSAEFTQGLIARGVISLGFG